eukprot:g28595.t1
MNWRAGPPAGDPLQAQLLENNLVVRKASSDATQVPSRRASNGTLSPVQSPVLTTRGVATSESPHPGTEGGKSSAATQPLWALHVENQFTALAERINAGVTTLQRQCELDRRRLTQVEKKLDAKTAEADKHDGRERWAEVQGSVSGLLEETQALARRLDGLDERLWARTSGSEASKQRNRDLEQQVQALEQQNRLAAAAAEELQKRQATKIRRTEHSMEEVMRRMEKLEEELRQRAPPQRDGYMEAKFIAFEQNQETTEICLVCRL